MPNQNVTYKKYLKLDNSNTPQYYQFIIPDNKNILFTQNFNNVKFNHLYQLCIIKNNNRYHARKLTINNNNEFINIQMLYLNDNQFNKMLETMSEQIITYPTHSLNNVDYPTYNDLCDAFPSQNVPFYYN
jgi:hypothetical protein